MPRIAGIKKVLIIGSGAIKIGEAGEFDYSGAQAIKAIKEEGIEVVLVNPNVATIQTDKKFVGEKAYFLPITPEYVEQVIVKERPDSVVLGFGGQTALNCGTELAERGVFERYGVRVLGTSVEAIERADNRDLFRRTMTDAGIPICASRKANNLDEALSAAAEIGYPVMMRVAYTLGGQGTGCALTETDLRRMAPIAFAHSRISQVLIELYVGGWKEIEYEVLRDHADNCMIICSMENFDPMGVHTGDSIVVAPSVTVSPELYEKLKENSFRILRALGLVGECNIQYAVHPESGEFKVIEVNSRLSRSSALASKATGYPIAYATAKVALGYNMDEILSTAGVPVGHLEPEVDYVVVKMPRWDFQKFPRVNRRLGTQMKSVGEVMAIGKTFEEAIQKAARMLDIDRELTDDKTSGVTVEEIRDELINPTDQRLFYLVEALRRGFLVEEIHNLTGITGVFIEGLKGIVQREAEMKGAELTPKLIADAKKLGFSDRILGIYTGVKEPEVRAMRLNAGIRPAARQIRTAKRWSRSANYLYLTYNNRGDEVEQRKLKKVLVLGSGCYRIGSSVEFDWCCVNMSWALKAKGYDEVIMVNCNPETVSTDFDVMDKLYFEELTIERILDIVGKENPSGVVVSVGGQTPNRLAAKLEGSGIILIGSSARSIDSAEDRAKFSTLLDCLGIKQPAWSKLETVEKAKAFAQDIGYPVLVRPSYVLSGSAMAVVNSERQIADYLDKAAAVSKEYPVTISKFISGAREVEVDGVCDGRHVYLGPVIEHIENAGVHSGDATMSIPTLTIGATVEERVKETTRRIAKGLKAVGPFNVQYLVKDGELQVIECNLRASRSMPFVSKITGVNLMEVAATAITGRVIVEGEAKPTKHGVKSPVFSFMRLQGAEPLTGVEMVSTGEVACFGADFKEAFITSLIAAGFKMPVKGDPVLITVGEDKERAIKIAAKINEKGYELYATQHTCDAIRSAGIPCEYVYKISEGKKPSVLDLLEARKVKMVINSPSHSRVDEKALSDGYTIRRKTVEFGIPLITNMELAEALAEAIKADP